MASGVLHWWWPMPCIALFGFAFGTIARGRKRLCLVVVSELTVILQRLDQGDPHAAAELLPFVYEELRKLAAARDGARKSRADPASHLARSRGVVAARRRRPTGVAKPRAFLCRRRQAMRRILIDNARRKSSRRHGGAVERVSLEGLELAAQMDDAGANFASAIGKSH